MSPVTIVTARPPTMPLGKGNNRYTETDVRQVVGLGRCAQVSATTIADAQLKRAMEQAQREGSERPLVMQQLRTKIQLHRLQEGKDELTVQFEEPKKYQLTEEEEERLVKRKEKNREAAKKSRLKKRMVFTDLEKKQKELREMNRRLRAEVNQLYDLTFSYQKSIHHVRQCPRSLPANPPDLLSETCLSPPPSVRCGHPDLAPSSRDTSPQFSPSQQSFMRGSSSSSGSSIPAKRIDAGVAIPGLTIHSLSSSQDVRIPSRGDPAYTVVGSPCASPDGMVMDASCRVVPSSERGLGEEEETTQSDLTIVIDEASDQLPIARPAGFHLQPQVDEPLPQGISFMQLLEGPESFEMVNDAKSEPFLMLAPMYRPGTFLSVPLSGFSSAEMDTSPHRLSSPNVALHTTSPGSPSSPNMALNTTSPGSPYSPNMALKTTSPRSPSSPNMALSMQRLTRQQ